jgi:hypothetical protein
MAYRCGTFSLLVSVICPDVGIHDGLVEAADRGLLPQSVPLLFDKAREAVAEAVRRRPREW